MNVLITGGTGGIGFAVAEHFGREGHHVILADLNEVTLAAKQKELQKQGISCAVQVLNLTKQNSIDACASLPVDILVNNAGIQHVSRLDEFPSEKWAELVQVMLTGPAMLSKALLPGMRQRGFGRIVNIGSIHALVASPYKSAYVAAKHGLLGFSKVVALENADFDFTINTVCPAYVRTPLVDAQIADQCREHNLTEQEVIENIMLAPMPQKEFIGLDEIAHSASFLCQTASRHITAQTLVLDGGWTAR